MRLRKFGATPERGSPHRSLGLADWKKEWLENQSRYVLLECGHTTDINDKSVATVRYWEVSRQMDAHCFECDRFVRVGRPMSLTEYLGLHIEPIPDEPPF